MLLGANLIAVLLAFALPLALFVSRHVVRSQRAAQYNDIVATLFPEGGSESWPQLETVRTKYATGSSAAGRNGEHFLTDANRDPHALIFTGLFFGAFSFMGFALLLVPATVGATHATTWYPVQLMFLPEVPLWTSASGSPQVAQIQLVAAFGFLGAYVTAAQYLIRQLLNYELGAIAFLRATFQLFLGVVVAVTAYRALSDILGGLNGVFGREVTEVGAGAWWLGAAFLVGLAPEAGLSWLADQLKLRFRKRVDLASLDTAFIAPLEVIDGIDSGIRFRLEESNIYDVQNLATQNPVELCVDTPYGLLQIFDWILQAQLCTVVGQAAFEGLRRHKIRTIFDLERAVIADGAPQGYILGIGEVLFGNASEAFKTKAVGAAPGAGLTVEIIQHAVGVVSDDLHVHRLRSLWRRILKRSTSEQDRTWLYRRGLLPGDHEEMTYGASDSIHWADHAAFLGRLHRSAKADLKTLEGATSPDSVAIKACKTRIKLLRDSTLEAAQEAVKANAALWIVLRKLWEPPSDRSFARQDLDSFAEDEGFKTFFNPA
jgi:hypothetical protein